MIGIAIPLNSLGLLYVEQDMQLKDDVDRIALIRRVVELAAKVDHPFKIMVDRVGMQQLFTEMPDEFQETSDHYFWTQTGHDKIMLYRNDNVSGVWVEYQ